MLALIACGECYATGLRRTYLSAASRGPELLFAGGSEVSDCSSFQLNTVEALGPEDAFVEVDPLGLARCGLAATSLNGIAFFGGGNLGGSYSDMVRSRHGA